MGKPPRHRSTSHKSGSPNANKRSSDVKKKSPNHAAAAATVAASPAASPAQQSQQQQQQKQQSLKGVTSSNSSTGSAPSSVMCVPASPLARELSDLSGSYMNGNTAPRSSLNRSFGNSVCSEEPVQGFWRQAYLLSTHSPREPPTPPPVASAPASAPPAAAATSAATSRSASASASALIVMERNGVIELVKNSDDSGSNSASGEQDTKKTKTTTTGSQHDNLEKFHDSLESVEDDLLFLSHTPPSASLLLTQQQGGNNDYNNDESAAPSSRIPILILLMDPGRKQYEIMQLWVDPRTDLVRDVLHALQRKLSDKWRQDYDGLFQLRGNQYCQLVHILSIAKYDVRPRELWVAKPWSMAAKSTIDLANDCIRQLKAGGLLSIYAASSPGKNRIKNFLRSGRNSPVLEEDGPLTLSDEALKRLWFPDGVMKHHHACQFLSFRVPAIPSRVLGQPLTAHSGGGGSAHPGNSNNNRGFLGSLLGAPSQSFDDVSSQLSNPSDVMLLPFSSGETPTKLNSSSSTASPGSSRRRHGYSRQRLPTPVNLDSKWQPSGPLEVVGEVIVSSSGGNGKDTATGGVAHADETEEVANVSTILADLESTNNISELNQTHELEVDDEPAQQQQQQTQQQQQHQQLPEPFPIDDENNKKEQRCSLWTMFAPLNCVKRSRSFTGGSRKGDDGYSSSWGGDQGSSAKNSKSSKNSKSNNSDNNNNNDDGRETPTSKGSGDGDDANDSEPFAWHRAGGEEHSIVSDSAPLLGHHHPHHHHHHQQEQQQEQQTHHHHQQQLPEQALHQLRITPAHQPTTVVSASPFARYYK